MPFVKKFALLSVSDKTSLVDFARQLLDLGYTLLSTGGTQKLLHETGLAVTGVSEHTGFAEIMDGRVKTLHPRIHGGILGREQDADIMQAQDIPPIDLVIVNLYPFEAVTADDDCSLADAIENIDIGGPAMVRAAAKNHARVAVVVDPADYAVVADELASSGSVSESTRFALATRAFAHTARYDGLVAAWLSCRTDKISQPRLFPEYLTPQFQSRQELRYGENPHQAAAFYVESGHEPAGIAAAEQLQGKALSYNNINDADAALECASQFEQQATCVIVKHANPCGVAVGASNTEAYLHAFATDPVSSFGGIIAFNQRVGAEVATAILEKQFVEVVIAPAFSDEAIVRFASKPNVRLLRSTGNGLPAGGLHYQQVSGGLLIQHKDADRVSREDCRGVTEREPTQQQWFDMLFAWKVARMAKSNAIIFAANGRTLGVGAGQMSRVDSARIARWKAKDAGLVLDGAAMASDAFFPFRDGIDTAAEAGIKAVIQPGGSMRDDEVIAAANEHDIAMVFTGVRHFRH
ncbi:MAG: bifunctional phosphoribosylaminoimidazolecarboxamide formyltransferase/IMP cyclohydrolase [Gammaproteobacteria bacterium]|nr:MAG: bifunctional phosphoribosylaminoimidazolecarboxamide formyltransferase/IMP cyclohydrolase [Gammaproteobacteria bacterium]